MLILTRKKGESIVVNEHITITILESSDGKVKIGIDAPKNVTIHREEVFEEIKEENTTAKTKVNIDTKELNNFLKNS